MCPQRRPRKRWRHHHCSTSVPDGTFRVQPCARPSAHVERTAACWQLQAQDVGKHWQDPKRHWGDAPRQWAPPYSNREPLGSRCGQYDWTRGPCFQHFAGSCICQRTTTKNQGLRSRRGGGERGFSAVCLTTRAACQHAAAVQRATSMTHRPGRQPRWHLASTRKQKPQRSLRNLVTQDCRRP